MLPDFADFHEDGILALSRGPEHGPQLRKLRNCPGCSKQPWSSFAPPALCNIEGVREGALQWCHKCHYIVACLTWASEFIDLADVVDILITRPDHIILQLPSDASSVHLQCALSYGM